MKCILTFQIHGRLAVTACAPIQFHGTLYELEVKPDGTVVGLRATVSVPDPAQWPSLSLGPCRVLSGVYPPAFTFIHLQLRVIQGILSFFGLERIEIDNPTASWIPENDQERQALAIRKYSVGVDFDRLKAVPTPFDLVARAFLVSEDLFNLEKPLSFYRHGLTDLAQERYIEAVYDFFYALELLFANGKTREYQVVEEFRKSSDLREAVERIQAEPPSEVVNKPDFCRRFAELFKGGTLEEVYKKLFRMRGALHHAKGRGPGTWHPDHQLPYRFEAIIFAELVSNALFPKVLASLDREEVKKTYCEMVARTAHAVKNGP